MFMRCLRIENIVSQVGFYDFQEWLGIGELARGKNGGFAIMAMITYMKSSFEGLLSVGCLTVIRVR
jgi:hypothetical protein